MSFGFLLWVFACKNAGSLAAASASYAPGFSFLVFSKLIELRRAKQKPAPPLCFSAFKVERVMDAALQTHEFRLVSEKAEGGVFV